MPNPPRFIVAFDVETTGLRADDRIVTLAAWRLDLVAAKSGRLDTDFIHIIADPGKRSHPRAEQVHGYSDWVLRHQQPFSEQSAHIREFLFSGDLVIAHNATFDLRFLNYEFGLLGESVSGLKPYCTMNAYRDSGRTGRASLGAVCGEAGLQRQGARHGALEDAWLAAMVYLWLNQGYQKSIKPFDAITRGARIEPTNYRKPPAPPIGSIPSRRGSHHAIARELSAAKKNAKATLIDAVRPTALLLLEVARSSDALATEEIEVFVSLIKSTAERLGLPSDSEIEFEVLAEIFEVNLSQNQLTRSARALCADEAARRDFPRWFAAIATADGRVTAAERDAIERVKAAIRRVMPD